MLQAITSILCINQEVGSAEEVDRLLLAMRRIMTKRLTFQQTL